MIKQGFLYRHNFGPRQNHLQEGRRPAMVVQSDRLNDIEAYPNVIVVPVTTKKRSSPTYVALAPSPKNDLSEPSWAITNQIFTVAKEDLGKCLGEVNASELYGVKEALRGVLDL